MPVVSHGSCCLGVVLQFGIYKEGAIERDKFDFLPACYLLRDFLLFS
jgi:hypothetical protein